MKKVLQVVSCLARGGTETFIMNHFRNIDKQEFCFDFMVFTNIIDPAYEKEIYNLGGKIYQCTTPSIFHIYRFIKKTMRIIKENGPYYAVHSHVNIANSWVVYAAYKAGVNKRISHSHDISGKDTDNMTKKLYIDLQSCLINKYSTLKLACSKSAGKYLYGELNKKNRWAVIHNGIDVYKFLDVSAIQTDKLRKELKIANYKHVFGNITRYDEKKNISFVIDVFKEILIKRPDSILLLGGVDGGQLQMIKNKVREYGLIDNVRFIGVRDDIEVCLSLIDVYIFPSHFEGLGIVLLEAQAAGVYCVSSNNVPKEVDIGLGLIKFISLEKKAKEWSDIIIDVLEYKRPTNANIIRKFYENGYDIRKSVKKLEAAYGGDQS